MDEIRGCTEKGTRGVMFVRPRGCARVGVSERAPIAIANGKGFVCFGDASCHRLDGERESNFTHKNSCFGQFIYIRSRFGKPSSVSVLCYGNVTVMLRQCYGNVLEKSVAKVILIFEICKRKMDNFYFWLKN